MASTPSPDDDLFDEFLTERGHETEIARWDRSYNKKQCPDCGGINDETAVECDACGWQPGG